MLEHYSHTRPSRKPALDRSAPRCSNGRSSSSTLTFGSPPHSPCTSMSTRSRSEPRVEEASTGRRLSSNHRTHPQDHAKEHQWQLEDKYVESNGRMDRRLPNKVHVRLVTRGCA